MDGVTHPLKHNEHQSLTLSSLVLPSSSLRDIISLVFVLLFLPQTMSLVLLICYILVRSELLDSNLISSLFLNDKQLRFVNIKAIVLRTVNIFVLNSMLYYVLKLFIIKKKFFLFSHLVLLSKCIIACDLIGSSSIDTSISNRKFQSKIQYENKILDKSLINLILCYLIVNYINYTLAWASNKIYHNFHYHNVNKYYIILSLYVINSTIFHKIIYIHQSTEDIPLNIATEINEPTPTIDLSPEIRESTPTKPLRNGIAIKNFENFIVHPFNHNIPLILKNKYSSSINVTFQPFWSLLAGIKAIVKNPNSFNGKYTRCKNNGGEFINCPTSLVKISILLIDESKIILKFLDKTLDLIEKNLKIKINDINWSYFQIMKKDDEVYLIIYGLISLFQYEIDILYENKNLNHFIINTIENKKILNESLKENSSLVTLRTSLISTAKNLNDLKVKLKKFKKEEHKKVTELKNSIDNLKNKISKYADRPVNNDNRTFGKLKGLKHSIIQLENDIESLKETLKDLSLSEMEDKRKFAEQESDLLSAITKLNEEFGIYEERINEEKTKIRSIKVENQTMESKKSKLLNKQQTKKDEIIKLQNDLKNFKKFDIAFKFQKRTKKVSERFDQILPKVIDATSDLQVELEELLNK